MTAEPGTGGKVTRRDLLRSWVLWTFFSHANYNYERLQATAFAHAMTPIIRRLYHTKDETRAALQRHLVFFNTEPNVGGVIHGAVIAMEEQRANGATHIDDDAINSVKTGLMGPLAGIGDTISQGTITPLLLAIGIGITGVTVTSGTPPDVSGLSGNPLGAIVFIVLEVAAMLAIAYVAYTQGYYRGRTFVTDTLRSGVLDRMISGATVLGNLVLGALAAQFVLVYLAPTVSINGPSVSLGTYPATPGGQQLNLQTDILDKIFPGLLPLGLVLLTWWLLRRGSSPIRLLVVYLAIALLGAIPVFSLSHQPAYVTDQCGAALFQPYGACVKPAPSQSTSP
ncbi:MAG TPA: PTS system mannose/fructose/sorbose family transporter subunit IID [Candidatus Limnocylindrales bacterium]